MSEPRPDHDPHVPDAVLDELLAAFSEPEADDSATRYDFDDPSIDRILGLEEAEPDAGSEPEAEVADTVADEQPAVEPAPEPEPETGGDTPPRRTIVIPEDDQPDTVYLDVDAEERFYAVHGTGEGEGRSTVVIGDLDDGTVPVEPAPTMGSAGIDPRIRARRIAVRRSEGRRRLLWVGVAAFVVLLIVAGVAVVASPIFDVEDVRVNGAVYTDEDVLADIVSDLEGDPVLLVDTEAIEERLERVPWVERARVSTDFPHGVVIDIRERSPLATFQGGDDQWRVIDVQGRVLDVIAGQPVAYMLITGDHPDTDRGQFAGAPYAAAALLVQSLPAEIRQITRSVGLDPATGSLTMSLEGPDGSEVEVRLGDADELDEKLARLLTQVRSGLDGVIALDVSTEEIGVIRG